MVTVIARISPQVRFAGYGSLVDGHEKIIDEIEKAAGAEITKIEYAGEEEWMGGKLLVATEVAGVIPSYPELSEGNSVQYYRNLLEKNVSLKDSVTPGTRFLNWTENKKHLHPELEYLSDYRHNLRGKVARIEGLYQVGTDPNPQPGDVEYVSARLKVVAEEVLRISSAMKILKIHPLNEYDTARLESLLQDMKNTGLVNELKFINLISLLNMMLNITEAGSPYLKVFQIQ